MRRLIWIDWPKAVRRKRHLVWAFVSFSFFFIHQFKLHDNKKRWILSTKLTKNKMKIYWTKICISWDLLSFCFILFLMKYLHLVKVCVLGWKICIGWKFMCWHVTFFWMKVCVDMEYLYRMKMCVLTCNICFGWKFVCWNGIFTSDENLCVDMKYLYRVKIYVLTCNIHFGWKFVCSHEIFVSDENLCFDLKYLIRMKARALTWNRLLACVAGKHVCCV